MAQKQTFSTTLMRYGLWILATAAAAVTAFQIHATLLYIGFVTVQNPATRIPGWNIHTMSGLSRFLVLILGMFWLGASMFMKDYLVESKPSQLKQRSLRLFGGMAAVYCFSYLLLWILSLL